MNEAEEQLTAALVDRGCYANWLPPLRRIWVRAEFYPWEREMLHAAYSISWKKLTTGDYLTVEQAQAVLDVKNAYEAVIRAGEFG